MKCETLEVANKLHEEIKELENFIFTAERVWTGKINIRKIIACGFGAFCTKEFEMNNKIKNKVLDVLYEYLKELQTELNNL